MAQITLDQLKALAQPANGPIGKVYLHWTAGHYGQQFPDYHLLVDQDGTIYATVDDLTTHLNHTYMRNTGGIGIGAMCMVGATTVNFGPEPLTDAQIEAMAQVMAILSQELSLPLDINCFLTHAEAGDNMDGENPGYEANGYPDGKYGPLNSCERWDLWMLKPDQARGSGGNILRGKAIWYQQNGVA
ncbi:MAG: N-acetylmuramoyl-L-alanine amidase [Negativicutes bacterium]|nr:N-acetylmuramoyl-L-alanine amidase [Negativicutes bacterium]